MNFIYVNINSQRDLSSAKINRNRLFPTKSLNFIFYEKSIMSIDHFNKTLLLQKCYKKTPIKGD